MNQEQLLQECKDEVAKEKLYSSWAELFSENCRNPNYLLSVLSQASDLYAQRMSEKFAEWCGNNRYWYNIDVENTWYKLIPNKDELDISKRYTTSELYQIFITELNKEK